jgi:hypothetical protein
MPAGYVPQWISLIEAIHHVGLILGSTTEEEAWKALKIPLREGAILSRFRGQEVGDIGAAIEGHSGAVRPGWWYTAEVFADGSVEFAAEQYDFRRPPRREIEIRWSDLLRFWPKPAEAAREPAPTKPPPPRLKPFWAEAEKVIMRWLADDGCPEDRDGGQAKLEARTAELLIARGWEAGAATIRRHVRACMERHRKNTEA